MSYFPYIMYNTEKKTVLDVWTSNSNNPVVIFHSLSIASLTNSVLLVF
jgi:hypothetical protein